MGTSVPVDLIAVPGPNDLLDRAHMRILSCSGVRGEDGENGKASSALEVHCHMCPDMQGAASIKAKLRFIPDLP